VTVEIQQPASQGGSPYCATMVRLVKDDLTAMDVDAFVHYTREDLALGSGYGNAIQQRGGTAIKNELDAIGSIGMCDAVITGGGALKARHIIHACGPKFQEPDLEDKLRRTVCSILQTATANDIKSLATAPLGTGFYGVPMDLSIRVLLHGVRCCAESHTCLEQLIVVANDKQDFDAVEKLFASL